MFKKFFVLIAGLLLLGIPNIVLCLEANALPDLITARVRRTGSPTVNVSGSVEVPVRVRVKNRGNTAAGIFKVHVQYTSPTGGPYVVAFTVPGQSSIWYPFTSGPLAPGDIVAFDGKLTFHPSVRGVEVTLWAYADSCSGDEFMPDYCRVLESREDNNLSVRRKRVSLP